ncbi:MAG: ECF transporter S component [Clostridia bacterium]|nr:ECF transporter S component [Clostridia bacterium]
MKNSSTRELVLLSVLSALVIFLCFITTVVPMPSGLNITFSLIPLAIAAIALGVKGGTIVGAVFGLVSFLQCFGIIGTSGMGAALFNEAKSFKTVILLFVQRFIPRLIDGALLGLIFKWLSIPLKEKRVRLLNAEGETTGYVVTREEKRLNLYSRCAVTGFCAAFINTALFMSALVLLFGSYDYMKKAIAGRAFFAYVIASVGINGLVEMIVTPILVGTIGYALYKSGHLKNIELMEK